jgi:DNA-binding transcriptional ArsR family regulator
VIRRTLTAARTGLLDALLEGPKSLSELESRSGRRKPTLLKHLRALEEDGVVRKETVTTHTGRETRYSLRPYTLVLRFDPGTGTVLKLEAPEALDVSDLLVEQVPQGEFRQDVMAYLDSVARACRGWTSRPWVVLFGSVSRGEGTWKSDIDALIVLGEDRSGGRTPLGPRQAEGVLRRALAQAAEKAGHLLKPQFVPMDAFLRTEEGIVGEAKDHGIVVREGSGGGEVWRQLKRYRTITS